MLLSSFINVNFCSSVEGFWAVSQGKFDREILKTSAILGLQADRLTCIGKVFWLAFILPYEGAFVNTSFLHTVFSRTQEIQISRQVKFNISVVLDNE